MLSRVFLWLFVVDLGIALGAGLYEHRIVLPQWIHADPGGEMHFDAEAARLANTGIRFWAFVTTAPLTLLTIVNLVLALRSSAPFRRWWLGAGLVALGERAFTFSYFIPTMVALMNETLVDAEAAREALEWARLNYLRHVLNLVAFLLALKALSMTGELRDGQG